MGILSKIFGKKPDSDNIHTNATITKNIRHGMDIINDNISIF